MEESVFLVKWYGPFTSREDIKVWQEEYNINSSLYLLHECGNMPSLKKAIIVECQQEMFLNAFAIRDTI